jgi:molybdopterin synthase sulfur carrier subunit
VPRVVFTPNLERHVSAPPAEVDGGSVREVLDRIFEDNPRLRGYVLDDQGRLRKHVAVFVNGEMIEDRVTLRDGLGHGDEVFVMQALSGG